MEPWDGPASVSFTDGRLIGATLDRNGLRPGRWMVTTDGWVILASETGTFRWRPSWCRPRAAAARAAVRRRLERGQVFADGEIEAEIAARRPYGKWFEDHVVALPDLPEVPDRLRRYDPLRVRQLAFGWTAEDVRVLVTPLASKAKEADGSMGSDVPWPCCPTGRRRCSATSSSVSPR